jgi:G3E family GTPase
MNALVKTYRTHNAQLDLDALLGINAFDLDRALEIDPLFLSEDAHEHDESVYSIAFVEERPMDQAKLETWVKQLLETKGPDIFRMKGILNIAGQDQRFVFQGVHMIFDGKVDRAWKADERRKNELVFIGRNLNETELKQGFLSCLAA